MRKLNWIERKELSYQVNKMLNKYGDGKEQFARLFGIGSEGLEMVLAESEAPEGTVSQLCMLLGKERLELGEPPFNEKLFRQMLEYLDGLTKAGVEPEQAGEEWAKLLSQYPEAEVSRNLAWLQYICRDRAGEGGTDDEIRRSCIAALGFDPELKIRENAAEERDDPLKVAYVREIRNRETYEEIQKMIDEAGEERK